MHCGGAEHLAGGVERRQSEESFVAPRDAAPSRSRFAARSRPAEARSPGPDVRAPARDLGGAVPADVRDRTRPSRVIATFGGSAGRPTQGARNARYVTLPSASDASKRTVPSGANSVNAPAVPQPTNAPPSGSCSRFPIAHAIRGLSGWYSATRRARHRAHVEREPHRPRDASSPWARPRCCRRSSACRLRDGARRAGTRTRRPGRS